MLPQEFIPSFRETVIAGGYNLLLGAGASRDSRGPDGRELPSTEQLTNRLCRAVEAPLDTPLVRVARLLDHDQKQALLVRPFAPCTPGPTLARLPDYLWRRIFTLNIDDALEAQYEAHGSSAMQDIRPLNYDAPYEPTPERDVVQSVHLHGWAREPEGGFVFSHQDYARTMTGNNPWMHMLAEILATEPFIIAGTTLNEVDLEFYLSRRTPATPRRGTGPSLLVEPHPNVVTKADCERHGLILVEGSLRDFLAWIKELIPTPPSVGDLLIPDTSQLFRGHLDNRVKLRFFSDFRMVEAADLRLPKDPTPFLYGRQPSWREIDQHLDIPRPDYDRISAAVTTNIEEDPQVVIVLGEPGAGTTTAIKRVAHIKARTGMPVLHLRTASGIDVDAARRCLGDLRQPALLLVDNVADYASQLARLLEDEDVAANVVVLGGHRDYRREHVEVLLDGPGTAFLELSSLSQNEALQLVERFRSYALIGLEEAILRPEQFAGRIRGQTMTVAVCRILNDFRPLDEIAQSLWEDTEAPLRQAYLCVALAQHCHWTGLRQSLAQQIAGPSASVTRLLQEDAPLRLTDETTEEGFLLALNWAICERVIFSVAADSPSEMLDAFGSVAAAIAPFVNRRAIIERTPEAQLARRLFDVDTVVKPLLRDRAAEFFRRAQHAWEWNSRYWEQRALLYLDYDLEVALRHARHAVSVERHPFPLTTLSKVLLARMEAELSSRDEAFAEALVVLQEAIELEADRSRVSVHPFMSLIAGTSRFLELHGFLTEEQWQVVTQYAGEAEAKFPNDAGMSAALRRLDGLLENPDTDR